MKIPLSLKIFLAGTALDIGSKLFAVYSGWCDVLWHNTTGSFFYLYTPYGLDESVSREAYMWRMALGLVLLVVMFLMVEVLPRRLGWTNFSHTNLCSSIALGFMMVTFAQAMEAMFFPVPNFIPAHSSWMLIFYDDIWLVATVADYARTAAIAAMVAGMVTYIWDFRKAMRAKKQAT
jgi:hypothetical protein